jgi:Sec-independent protein translocase protein TatA
LFTSLQIKFLIFIAVVFIITIGCGVLITRQMKIVGQKALEAKQRQDEYRQQLEEEQRQLEEQNRLEEEQKKRAEEQEAESSQ